MKEILTKIPVRTKKPRENGLTMMMDKGLSLRQAEDFLYCNKEYTDIIKLGFGTSIITPNISDKIINPSPILPQFLTILLIALFE